MAEIDLTAGGRLTVSPFVNKRRVGAMSEMIAGSRLGGYAGERARTELKETLSTSDAPFSFAHLVNLRNLPAYDAAQPNWNFIADTEIVPDFTPVAFYTLTPNFGTLENGKDTDGNRLVAPHVAELDTYQYGFGYTQESAQIAVEKRGFKWGISLERAVNDINRTITRIPGDMLTIGLKTDDFVVYRALMNGVTSYSEQEAGTDYITGDAVPANSPATPAAFRVAMRQIGVRRDENNNRIPLASRYYVVVPVGQGDEVQYALNLAKGIISVQDGSLTYAGPTGDSLGRIAGVLESEWVNEGWYLVPAVGTTVRPSLVRVTLQGYTSPEVYVSNFNGAPLAGGASSNPFTAFSFDNDSVDLKFRQFTNAVLVSEQQLSWSNGTGS